MFLTPRKRKQSKKVYWVMKLIFSYQNIPPKHFDCYKRFFAVENALLHLFLEAQGRSRQDVWKGLRHLCLTATG